MLGVSQGYIFAANLDHPLLMEIARRGDVIVVGPGTYAETIATAKRLTVLEQAKNSVVLSGTVPAGAVLTLGTTCAGGRWDC